MFVLFIKYLNNVETSPDPHTPELGLDGGVGFQGDFHRSAIALAGDALGFNPGVQVAGGFDGHGRARWGSDLEGQGTVGRRGLEGDLGRCVHGAAGALNGH